MEIVHCVYFFFFFFFIHTSRIRQKKQTAIDFSRRDMRSWLVTLHGCVYNGGPDWLKIVPRNKGSILWACSFTGCSHNWLNLSSPVSIVIMMQPLASAPPLLPPPPPTPPSTQCIWKRSDCSREGTCTPSIVSFACAIFCHSLSFMHSNGIKQTFFYRIKNKSSVVVSHG